MSKVVGFIVGAALIAIGVVTGNVGLIIQGSAMIITQAVVDLTAPKTPARQASEMSIQLGEQPRSMLIGETFTAGSLVDGFNYGGKYGTDWECLIIRLADHKVEGMTGFYVNDEYVRYTGNGNYPQFDSHHFELYFRDDTTTQPLPDVVLDHAPGWTAADIGESGADVVVCYLFDPPDAKKPAWPGGRPTFGFVIKGKKMYDPRFDDTVTGGSGDQRWEDPDTWVWSDNAAVCRYNWARGVYADDDVTDQTKLLIGRGLTAEEAPPENIIPAANLCDEVVATLYKYEQPTSTTLAPFFTNVAGRYLATWTQDQLEWFDLFSRQSVNSASASDALASSVINWELADDGTAYAMGTAIVGAGVETALYVCPIGGPYSRINPDPLTPIFSGPTRVFETSEGRKVFSAIVSTETGYIDMGVVTDIPGVTSLDFCAKSDGSVWMLSVPSGSSAEFTLSKLTGTPTADLTVTGLVTRSGPNGGTVCHVGTYNHFLVMVDGKFYIVDDTTGTIKDSGSFTLPTLNLPRNDPGRLTYWADFTEVSLEDCSTIRTLNASNWTAETTAGIEAYDPINHALWTDKGAHETIRFLDLHGGYRIAGPIYSNQEFLEVEEMFAAATAGSVITHEGSVELEPGQAKSVVASFTDDDLLVGSQVSWNQGFLSESDAEWVNTVVARYVEPSQRWTDHGAPVVRDTDDILSDGRPREASITLRLVRYEQQALRVAEINRRLGRLWGRATVKLGPRFCEIEDGDWISWTSARYFAGGSKTFRVEAYSIDEKWQVSLTLREINGSVYADDAIFPEDQSTGIPTTPPPDIGEPDSDNWDLAAVIIPSGGASIPALEITGTAADDEMASAIIFEYWKSDGVTDPTTDPDSIPWTSAGSHPPSTTVIDITTIEGGATYYAAVSYVVSGETGDRLVLGPVTVAGFSVLPPDSADTTVLRADDTLHTVDLA